MAADAIDACEPEYWGTFTQEYQEWRGKGSSFSVGTGVSNEATIHLGGVTLIGHTVRGGVVEARYKPDGVLGDAASYTVHTAESIASSPFSNWFLVVLGCGGLVSNIWLWRNGERG